MIHKLAKSGTIYLSKKQVVPDATKEIYEYGIELIISGIIGIFNVMIISVIEGYMWHGLIFLMCIIPIRTYTGGYHADTYFRCNVAFLGTFICSVVMWKLCKIYNLSAVIWILTLLSFVLVGYIAPIDNQNKTLSKAEKEIYKKKSVIIYAMVLMISLVIDIAGYQSGVYIQLGRFSSQTDIILYIQVVLNIIVILMLLGKLKEDYKRTNCD